IPPCSTVLAFGFKRDLNSYLAEFGPGVSASTPELPAQTVRTLSDVIAFNNNFIIDGVVPPVGLKYGQAIAQAADILDTRPGQDLSNYQADRALDLKLTRRCGLDVLFTGVVPDDCRGLVADQGSCAGRRFDAVLFPANFGANAPARAGYPSVIVPAGIFPNPASGLPPRFDAKPSPFGVTFSGPAFSERKLIAFAFAFQQATQVRHQLAPLGPFSAPPLPPSGAVSLPLESENASRASSEATSKPDSSDGIRAGVFETLEDIER